VIYKTTNAGIHWIAERRVSINPIFELGTAAGFNVIAAGQYGTILKLGLGVTSTGNNNTSTPKEFSLEQNFPNPFNPNTNVKFSIPFESNVKLTVYDISGKEVSKLVNSKMNAGSHTVNFNASEYSSGVYFYRLDVTGKDGINYSDTKKMVLVK